MLHYQRLSICILTLALASVGTAAEKTPVAAVTGKTFIDYFQPTPLQAPLTRATWGAVNTLPRDVSNGLEDVANRYCYWDGKILKGPDGRYHMFASRWDEAKGHKGWVGSVAVQAVSQSLYGPYVDQGPCWPEDQGGKGHNVTALVLPDGRYAIVVSETRPGDVFVSRSLDGPWKRLGSIRVDTDKWRASNYSILVRPDGDFEIVPRSGQILISHSGVLGPYRIMGPSIYPAVAGLSLENLEDPVVWFSGGLYHIVVNSWSSRCAWHLTSPNGINHWTLHGLAYDPRCDFIRYADGTVNHWEKLERPGVVMADGHVVAVTLAGIDVPKEQENGNDNHGSKVLVIPFDGAALDRDLQRGSAAPVASNSAPTFRSWAPTPPMGWNSWDYFGTSITEAQANEQAAFEASHLLPVGWQYFVVDIQWYEPQAAGHDYRAGAQLAMDDYGRLLPALNRFPTSANGAGFKPLADHIHQLGLKFGVHLLRGIPRQAVERNCPILGTPLHAGDIADRVNICPWNSDMFGVDTSKPGAQAYYDSVFALFASWGIDYVKVDDLSRPYHRGEIDAIRRAIDRTGRPIVLSLSPGNTPLRSAVHVTEHANLWRISDDFWDRWLALKSQFGLLEDWNRFRVSGAWPDADMLPLGWLLNGQRPTRFTKDEQTTLMTLWSIARSPLMDGGDLTRTDDFTLSLLTNPEVIAVNQHSLNNRPLFDRDDLVAWTADVPDSKDKYLAVFNKSDAVPMTAANAAFVSGPIAPRADSAAKIDLDLGQATRLFLVAKPMVASRLARAYWRNPSLKMVDGSEVKLTSLKWSRSDATWDSTAIKKDAAGEAVGVTALAPAVVEFDLPAGARRFSATAAIEPDHASETPDAKLQFLVVLAGPASADTRAGLPVKVNLADLGFTGPVKIRDLWSHRDLDCVTGEFAPQVSWHGAALYRLSSAAP
ncbi:MAG TPA: hypothetical protein VGL42_15370 [Opitutaceae bacterium]|jgi:hypothetical protein